MTHDAIIVGAGIVGAAVARALAAAGMDVVVVDRGQAVSGTSAACEGNLLVSDKGPGDELVLAQYAARLWREAAPALADQLGPAFPSVEYEPKGGLVVATTEGGASALLAFADSQREAGVDARVVDDPHAGEPDLTRGVTAAVFYPDDAQVQPTIAAEALLASARAHGATVLTGCSVAGPVLDADGALVGVEFADGHELRAPRIVVAAGPWSGGVSAALGAPLPVLPRRGELLVTAPMRQRVFHKVYDADYVGAVESGDTALQTSSVIESTRGGTVIIGSSRERVGFDGRLRPDVMQQIAAKAVRLFPFLAEVNVLRSYGGFRPFMPDHLPVVSPDHRLSGLWHAVGHEGAGIGLSLASAELLRDLMIGAPTAVDAAPFSTARATLAPYLDAVATDAGARSGGRGSRRAPLTGSVGSAGSAEQTGRAPRVSVAPSPRALLEIDAAGPESGTSVETSSRVSPRMMPASADPTRPGATQTVTITVDGDPLDGVLGQSIAGVIMVSDALRLRDTRHGAPRGVFCGIGVCFDCLVTVNDVPDVRACQRLAAPGDRVTTRSASEPAPAASARLHGATETVEENRSLGGSMQSRGAGASEDVAPSTEGGDLMRHVVVVGAGPAGLAAARAAREAGASVTLLDSSDRLGGQYWRHAPAVRPAANLGALHHEWSRFESLRGELSADDGCRVLTNAHVWALEAPGTVPAAQAEAPGADARPTLHVLLGAPDGTGRERITLRPDALVLATGAHDRTLPFPGWQLPGVVTGGAAQAFAKGERVAIGRRVVVAGAGPFLLPVAASLAQTGAKVLGVYEASRIGRLASGWLPSPWRLLRTPAKGAELAGYVAGQLRGRIPYRTGHAVIAAHGETRVEAVTIAEIDAQWRPVAGTARRVEVDAVCVSHGFTPRLELAVAAGCRLRTTASGERFVEVDGDQQTSVPGVFAAGEATGIGGADLALAEGAIAGAVAAAARPRVETGEAVAACGTRTDELAKARRDRAACSDFALRIDAAHGIRPGWIDWLDDDTVICRCEDVGYRRLRETQAATRSCSLRSLKLATRAGLGMCQGRVCGRTVEQLLGTDGATVTDRRPIAAPIRLGELAADVGADGRISRPSPRTGSLGSAEQVGHAQLSPQSPAAQAAPNARIDTGRDAPLHPTGHPESTGHSASVPHGGAKGTS